MEPGSGASLNWVKGSPCSSWRTAFPCVHARQKQRKAPGVIRQQQGSGAVICALSYKELLFQGATAPAVAWIVLPPPPSASCIITEQPIRDCFARTADRSDPSSYHAFKAFTEAMCFASELASCVKYPALAPTSSEPSSEWCLTLLRACAWAVLAWPAHKNASMQHTQAVRLRMHSGSNRSSRDQSVCCSGQPSDTHPPRLPGGAF